MLLCGPRKYNLPFTCNFTSHLAEPFVLLYRAPSVLFVVRWLIAFMTLNRIKFILFRCMREWFLIICPYFILDVNKVWLVTSPFYILIKVSNFIVIDPPFDLQQIDRTRLYRDWSKKKTNIFSIFSCVESA